MITVSHDWSHDVTSGIYIYPLQIIVNDAISIIYRRAMYNYFNIIFLRNLKISHRYFLRGKKYPLFVDIITRPIKSPSNSKERKREGERLTINKARRERSRKCEDRGISSESCGGSMSFYRLAEPHLADERSRFFRNSTPTPGWFIRIINRRDSHVETRATPALPFVGGRTRQLYTTHAARARFVHVKVLEHVTNLRAPIFLRVRSPWSLSEKSFTNGIERRFSLK